MTIQELQAVSEAIANRAEAKIAAMTETARDTYRCDCGRVYSGSELIHSAMLSCVGCGWSWILFGQVTR